MARRATIIIIVSGVVIFLIVSSSAILLNKSLALLPDWYTCQSEGCVSYARLLNDSVHRDAKPCKDFHHYVCGSRINSRSVLDDLLTRFQNEVMSIARKQRIRRTAQTVPQKAAHLFTLCEDILVEDKHETDFFKEVLLHAGVTWPNSNPQNSNPWDLLLYISRNFQWHSILRFDISDSSACGESDAPVFTIGVSPFLNLILERMTELKVWERYNHYFDFFYLFFIDQNSAQTSHNKTIFIEGSQEVQAAFALARNESLNAVTCLDTHSLSQHSSNNILWRESIERHFGLPRHVAFPVEVTNLAFFQAIARIDWDSLYTLASWHIVQTVGLFSNGAAVQSMYWNRSVAIMRHTQMCFKMTQKVLGFAFDSPYVLQKALFNVKQDAEAMMHRILLNFIEFAFNDTKSPKELETVRNASTHMFDCLDKCEPKYLEETFVDYNDARGVYGLTWMKMQTPYRALRSAFIGPPPFVENGSVQLYCSKSHSGLSLMPYAFDLPFYAPSLPTAIKFGGLGAVLAEGIASLFYSDDDSFQKSMPARTRECLSKYVTETRSTSLRNIFLKMITLGTLWTSYKEAQTDRLKASTLPGFGDLSSDQLFFLSWCYPVCGLPGAQDLCNLPLKMSVRFASTFGCTSATTLTNNCSHFP